jgi:dephospho-CoA kinase
VLAPDGSLDREKMASLVFPDPERLAELGAIVHPLVGQWMVLEEEAAVAEGGPASVIVHVVPLLTEHHLAGTYDVVILVDVSEELQVARLVARRGMLPGQARQRMAAQATRKERLAVASIVIDNSGQLADLDRRLDEVWAELQARAAAS